VRRLKSKKCEQITNIELGILVNSVRMHTDQYGKERTHGNLAQFICIA